MISQRCISRFRLQSGLFAQSHRVQVPLCDRPFNFSEQSSKLLPQIPGRCGFFSGTSHNLKRQAPLLDNAVPKLFGMLGMKLGIAQVNSLPSTLKFLSLIHSTSPKEFEKGWENRTFDSERNGGPVDTISDEADRNKLPLGMGGDSSPFRWDFEPGETGPLTGLFETWKDNRDNRPIRMDSRNRLPPGINSRDNRPPIQMDSRNRLPPGVQRDGRSFGRDTGSAVTDRNDGSINFVRSMIVDNASSLPKREYNVSDIIAGETGSRYSRYGVEQNPDIVHIKLLRNNTFVTVTDSKGNKKFGASTGSLPDMRGGQKVSRYSAEAAAEHVGRVAKKMGLKSVVIKVNGFTYFKKKRQAILSFRDGYTNSRADQSPVVYIEDTTQKAHNGCRLRKKRRI